MDSFFVFPPLRDMKLMTSALQKSGSVLMNKKLCKQ